MYEHRLQFGNIEAASSEHSHDATSAATSRPHYAPGVWSPHRPRGYCVASCGAARWQRTPPRRRARRLATMEADVAVRDVPTTQSMMLISTTSARAALTPPPPPPPRLALTPRLLKWLKCVQRWQHAAHAARAHAARNNTHSALTANVSRHSRATPCAHTALRAHLPRAAPRLAALGGLAVLLESWQPHLGTPCARLCALCPSLFTP
jgi:hypothetical protein